MVYQIFLWLYQSMRELLIEETQSNQNHLAREAYDVLDDLMHAEQDEIPEGFQVGASGVSPGVGKKTPGEVLSDERRTAWQAFHLGIAYNWRDLGDAYCTTSLEAFRDGNVVIIVSTSTLSTGVNIDGVRNVAIMSRDFDKNDIAQMIGRCGRRKPGFALLCGFDPPTLEEVVHSIPPPNLTVREDSMIWALFRMAQSTQLSQTLNDSRFCWEKTQWVEFMNRIPFPTCTHTVGEIYNDLLGNLIEHGLCFVDTNGKVIIRVSQETTKVCETDSEMGGILISLVSKINDSQYEYCETPLVPWAPLLVYWISRRSSLPMMTSQRRGTSNSLLAWDRCICESLRGITLPCERKMIYLKIQDYFKVGTRVLPVIPLRAWDVERLADLTLMSSLAIFGVETTWNIRVPREEIVVCLEEAEVYGKVLHDMYKQRYPFKSGWSSILEANHTLLVHARESIQCMIHPRTSMNKAKIYFEKQTPVLTYCFLTYNLYLNRSSPHSFFMGLLTCRLLPESARRKLIELTREQLNALFPSNWWETISPIQISGKGVEIVPHEEPFSD
jgi:hypothetical protein